MSAVSLLFKPLHLAVGGLIRAVDFVTSPRPLKRSADAQALVDEQCKNLTLYHFPSCPFCVRVRRQMKRLNLPIRLLDPRQDPQWMQTLQTEGGKEQVPCLQIVETDGSSTWLYESADINDYLAQRFPA